MEIKDMKVSELLPLLCLLDTKNKDGGCKDSPYKVGEYYLIRTITMMDTGKLVKVTEHELVLENAAWIADSGRFCDALKSLNFNEVEPFPKGEVIIGRGSIIDAVIIEEFIPKQK